MEDVGASAFNLDLGRRILIIIIFLGAFWYILNLFVSKVKAGTLKLPEFLLKQYPALRNLDQSSYSQLYEMKIIQRQMMPDGYELMVLDVNDRHILLSKHISSGVQYLTDLNE